ncbi:MAG: PHB depolymerase family esterase [Deltaproteobacteria bacterium]|nr:PHB depolymerase family esterase [Deltaproteobacteria bacterium]
MVPRGAPSIALVGWLLGLGLACSSSGGGEGSVEEGTFESFPYRLYVPPGLGPSSRAPLVLALHGCGADAEGFARTTRLDALADRHRFRVLYPQEIASHHEDLCWRWFAPSDQKRDAGEPAALVRMVRKIGEKHRTDERRVYATGLSSGGAMASILGACYPDVFAAIGVHSGEEYIEGLDREEAKRVPSQAGPDPDQQGQRAQRCAGDNARVLPVMVIHGKADELANPLNGEQVFRQFAQTNDLVDDGRDDGSVSADSAIRWTATARGGSRYSVRRVDRDSKPLLQWIEVEGLGHDWSGSAESGTTAGPDASLMFWRFFERVGDAGAGQAPEGE